MAEDSKIYFNGIDGETGNYLKPPLTIPRPPDLAREETTRDIECGPCLEEDFDPQASLSYWLEKLDNAPRDVEEGDPNELADAGWGVIFADEQSRDLLAPALQPLLSLRRAQAGSKYREFLYEKEESKLSFLARHGVGPGPAKPEKVPYYLLIVGSPKQIPYTFQYQLDMQYGVGRLYFDDVESYRRYAESVVAAESAPAVERPRAVFFGVRNQNDPLTQKSVEQLTSPLSGTLSGEPNWEVASVLREQATKARLGDLLGGAETPSFLFTAGHGVIFGSGNERQLAYQGSLVCSDWTGPGSKPNPGQFFSARDLDRPGVSLRGLIAFHFACYSAGVPEIDESCLAAWKERRSAAPAAFVSCLPQRMLAHEGGGALAVIGHVDQAFLYSFTWEQAGLQLAVFVAAFRRLLAGERLGWAMEFFGERYAELAAELNLHYEMMRESGNSDAEPDEMLWTAARDARNYAVVGDPAVRLAVAREEAEMEQGTEEVVIREPI